MDFVLSPRSVCEFRLFNFRKIVLPHQRRQAVVHFQRKIPLSALNPAFPNFPGSISTPTPRQANQDRRSTQVGPSSTPQPPPSLSSSSPKALLRFARRDESDLTNDRALPLPMPYPNSQPSSREEVEKMLACDPDVANCDTVVYQWTDKCQRCWGTGLVDVARRKGKHHVISTCVACTGLGEAQPEVHGGSIDIAISAGFVQRFTTRDDIPIMIDPDNKLGGN